MVSATWLWYTELLLIPELSLKRVVGGGVGVFVFFYVRRDFGAAVIVPTKHTTYEKPLPTDKRTS